MINSSVIKNMTGSRRVRGRRHILHREGASRSVNMLLDKPKKITCCATSEFWRLILTLRQTHEHFALSFSPVA